MKRRRNGLIGGCKSVAHVDGGNEMSFDVSIFNQSIMHRSSELAVYNPSMAKTLPLTRSLEHTSAILCGDLHAFPALASAFPALASALITVVSCMKSIELH